MMMSISRPRDSYNVNYYYVDLHDSPVHWSCCGRNMALESAFSLEMDINTLFGGANKLRRGGMDVVAMCTSACTSARTPLQRGHSLTHSCHTTQRGRAGSEAEGPGSQLASQRLCDQVPFPVCTDLRRTGRKPKVSAFSLEHGPNTSVK